MEEKKEKPQAAMPFSTASKVGTSNGKTSK
jgi:hypothetical protein